MSETCAHPPSAIASVNCAGDVWTFRCVACGEVGWVRDGELSVKGYTAGFGVVRTVEEES